MNSSIKYWPLLYTFFTRIWSVENTIYYLWTYLLPPISWILYLWISNVDTFFIKNIFLYIFSYIIFEIFYEIWYIYNDNYSIKQEKDQTKRVKEDFKKTFWEKQILTRIIVWIMLLYIMSLISGKFCMFLLLDIVFMLSIFSIHNYIRNYSINIITWIFLRISKISLFVILINTMNQNPDLCKIIEISILLFYSLDFYWLRLYQYNKKYGWKNCFNYWYSYFFITIILISFFIAFKRMEYLVPLIVTIPKILFFLKKNKNSFSLRNNR